MFPALDLIFLPRNGCNGNLARFAHDMTAELFAPLLLADAERFCALANLFQDAFELL